MLTVVALLHCAFALASFGFVAFAIMSVAMSGEYAGIPFAITWALLGLLNVLAVLALSDPHVPSSGLSRWASAVTALVFGGVFARSAAMGAAGPIEWSAIAGMLAVCLLSLFLTTRPQVKQWVVAVRRQAPGQGFGPRR